MALTETNYAKKLDAALKAKKLKAKRHDAPNGKAARVTIDDVTLARIFPGKRTTTKPDGSLRVYVLIDKLPAKLAKSFKATTGSGHSINVTNDDELALAADAIEHAASVSVVEEPPKSEPTKSVSKKRASTKRASAKKSDTTTSDPEATA